MSCKGSLGANKDKGSRSIEIIIIQVLLLHMEWIAKRYYTDFFLKGERMIPMGLTLISMDVHLLKGEFFLFSHVALESSLKALSSSAHVKINSRLEVYLREFAH